MPSRGTGPWRKQSWGEGGTVEFSREDRGTVEAAVGTGEWLETGIRTGAGGYASTGEAAAGEHKGKQTNKRWLIN